MPATLRAADVSDKNRIVHRWRRSYARLNAPNRCFLTCFSPGSAGFRSDLRDMAHLAAGPRRSLAVDVNGCAGNRQPFGIARNLVPDQVGHGDLAMPDRLAERPAGNRADVLLELRDRGAVQRPVPGIMHPRRNLVD